ncbi:phage major capsid protein [Sporosarcina koreensis]|uniref:phage major capsid protein n=1 Tax=Sporosarcina koreensis TaxID=334735 RepID=UPI00059000E3|nr:phage major capsid protein [Sporosarcina koreensis]
MKMELRTAETYFTSESDGNMKVSGYVNLTDMHSEVLGSANKFKEKISKGAFSRAIKNSQHANRDIDFLAEHDNRQLLASTKNSSLILREDEKGLYMEATITPTSWGKDAYTMIKSGLFKNMSFGFRTIKDSWKKISRDLKERTIEELELFEVSVVKNPAYSQSTIAARGINLIENVKIPELNNTTTKEERENKMKTVHTYNNYKVAESKKEQETREFNERLKFNVENREMNTTAGNVSVIPESVADVIVEKLDESSTVFSLARKFPTSAGSLKIPRETATEDGAFVGEGKNLVEGQLHLGHVELDQKRVGALITISRQFIHDSAVNMASYIPSQLAKRTFKAIEQSILRGTRTDEFKGIVPDQTVNKIELSAASTDDELQDLLLDMNLNIHPEYLQNSQYIMSRPFFNRVAKLRDAAGHYYVQNGIVNGKPTYTLFGLPVVITSSLEAGMAIGETPCIVGSLFDGYAISLKKGVELIQIQDTEKALNGSVGFLVEAYMDGAVYNSDALTKLVVTA